MMHAGSAITGAQRSSGRVDASLAFIGDSCTTVAAQYERQTTVEQDRVTEAN